MIEESFDPEVEDYCAFLEQQRLSDEYRPTYRALFISLWGYDPFRVEDKQ